MEYFKWTDAQWEKCESSNAAKIARELLCKCAAVTEREDIDQRLDIQRCLWLASTRVEPSDYEQFLKKDYDDAPYAEFRRECTYHWVHYCLSSRPEVDLYFITRQIDGRQIDRERHVQRAVVRNGQLTELLSPNGTVDAIGKEYLASLINWFLCRYDLATATRLMRYHWRLRSVSARTWRERLKNCVSSGNVLIPVVGVVLLVLIGFPYFGSAVPDLFHAWIEACARIIHGDSNWFTPFLVLLYPAVVLAAGVSLWRNGVVWFKLLIPRMIGGIIVGYLPLVFTEEAWDMIRKMHGSEAFLLVLCSLGFSLYYLFIEIHNTVQNNFVAGARALRVFFAGVLESFCIGIIASDIITRAFYSGSVSSEAFEPGLVGFIYPRMLYVYFPLALLVGIFVQIIWEDKPITEPL